MGLAERRAAMEFEASTYPELKKQIHEAAGYPVEIVVDWESLSKESKYLKSWNRAWPKIYFEPIIEAFKEICADDMGRAALKEKLAKIVVQNKKTSYSGQWSEIAEGTLTLDYMFTNVDDVKSRTTVLLKTLMDAL